MTTLSPKDKPTLLPCPFCGGPASIKGDVDYNSGKPNGLFWVQCDPCDMFPDSVWQKPYDEAIVAWNTRTASPITSDADGDRQLSAIIFREFGKLANYRGPDDPCDDPVEQGYGNALTNILAALSANNSIGGLVEALKAENAKLRRCLLPVQMTLAQAECVNEPIPDEAVMLHFMGSGASDQVTAGEVRDALLLERGEPK